MNSQGNILDLACGNWYTQSLATICRLKIPDLVSKDMFKDISLLSKESDTNEDALFRLLRALSSKGVFIQQDRSFRHSDSSLYLVSNHPSCFSSYCIMRGQDYQYRSWTNLEHSLRTGKSALQKTLGMSMFQYFESHPEERKHFDNAMASITKHVGQELKDLANTRDLLSSHAFLVDIGGGNGELLKQLLSYSDNAIGTILDIKEHVQNIQKDHPRISFLQGSFFEQDQIPKQGDVYILKYILHDWGNEECIRILTNIKNTMPKGSKLWIIESLIDDTNDQYHKMLDLQMLVCLADGARERTKQEYENLLSQSNMSIENIIQLRTLNLSLIIAS